MVELGIPEVAPYVGAWIETALSSIFHLGKLVAPYVGAWIETTCCGAGNSLATSHPTWVRGLKL